MILDPQYRLTGHQVARGTRPDAESAKEFRLLKNVSQMRATYQVRLLAYRASRERKKLIIEIPERCRIHGTLRDLAGQMPQTIRIVRT
jgi:hypothetical protein